MGKPPFAVLQLPAAWPVSDGVPSFVAAYKTSLIITSNRNEGLMGYDDYSLDVANLTAWHLYQAFPVQQEKCNETRRDEFSCVRSPACTVGAQHE